MSDEEILSAIDRFLENRFFHYALMINGKWGCGKTFFVENTLIPHIKKDAKKDINYISLYGIKNVDEITGILCSQAIRDKVTKKTGVQLDGKIGQVSSLLLSTFVQYGLSVSNLKDSGIEQIYEMIPDYNNNVIIFDDLERCNCDINEVLGYINNFTEHSNASVVLVANEDEIGNQGFGDNSVKQVNESYHRIKEKIIGLTITYVPNLKDIYIQLIGKIKDSNWYLGAILYRRIDRLVEIAEEEQHYNLRTFQFFLEKISTIYESIKNGFPILDEIIVTYTFYSSIRCMKGLDMPEWEEEFGEQELQKDTTIAGRDRIIGFRFIDDLIVSNSFDHSYVQGVLSRYKKIVEGRGRLKNDPFQKINKWWIAEDEQIEQWLVEIKDNISRGVYSTVLYPEIVKSIMMIKANGVMQDSCDAIVETMKVYISNTDPVCLEAFEKERFLFDERAAELYLKTMDELKSLIDDAVGHSEKQHYRDILYSDNWAESLGINNGDNLQHTFVYWVDIQELLERIKTSTNHELHLLRGSLGSIYGGTINYRVTKGDYQKLKEFKEGIECMDDSGWGSIKKLHRKWIVDDINRYLKKLQLLSKE